MMKSTEPSALARMYAWHRPLMAVAALMVPLTIVCIIGLIFDPREITEAAAWAKPLKFSVSILLYTVTWAWLIAHLPRWQKIAHTAGTIMAVALIIEQTAIVGAAAAGTTSHFNVSSPFATAVWAIMAISITVLYVCTFVTTIALMFMKLPTRSLTFALRAGAVLGLVGLGLAYLMTGPSGTQVSNFEGVVGAHTVGLADGGPQLPVLGWSTVAGDLRIPHFIGMHALQLLPLLAILLNSLGRKWSPLSLDKTRLQLMVVAAAVFAATLLVVTLQALSGQSIVQPAGIFLVAGWLIVASGIIASTTILVIGARAARAESVVAVQS